MANIALIIAGGVGTRMHQDIPKQFLSVNDKPVIIFTLEAFQNHPDIDAIIDGLKEQNLEKIALSMGNVLENVTVDDYPIIDDIKKIMKDAGALNAMMSGSGPTVFGIFADKKTAKEAQRKMRTSGLTKQIYLVNVHNNRGK